MARKRSKAYINLNKMQNFVYAFQRAPYKVREGLRSAMDKWAASAQGEYDSATGYGSGFANVKGSSFAKVEDTKKGKGLYVTVGHEAYIARFLEVGTKAHDVPHKRGSKAWVIRVSGIKGSKALSKVWDKRRKEIPEAIEKVIKNAIEGGE